MSAIGDLRTYGRSVGWRCAYVVLTVIATVIVVGPDNLAWRRGFIAWPAPYAATMPVGDHLQTSYFLWLWRHALTSLSHWPWQDVFQFAATGRHCLQPFGWPLALVSVPVDLLAGPIAAYNTLVLVAFLGGAAATYALARELGASTPAAAVAGFAFAFAPFRVVRSAVHLSGMLSPLIPLSLWYAERALRCSDDRARRAAWTFALVQLSIMASGELEFALDATMLSCGYLAVRAMQTPRASLRVMLAPMLALLFGAALIAGLIDLYVLRPSVAAGGRLASERAFFAPHLTDVLHRRMSWGFFERYVYPGKCIAALAILGAVTGKRAKRERAVVAAFAAVTVAAYALALMPGLDCFPPAGRLYGAIPLLAFSRTPGAS